MQWWVNDESGKESGWLKNEKKTQGPEDVPLSGWLVKDGGSWKIDDTLKITSGALIPSCLKIKIEASGKAADKQPTRLGEFILSKQWFYGHPVYKNDNGELLHMMLNGKWGVASTLGTYGIRGSPSYLCPSKSTTWEYWDWNEGVAKLGDITVRCLDNQ